MNKTTTWIGPGPNSYSITLHWRTEGTRGAVVVAMVTPMAKAFLADQQTIADLKAQVHEYRTMFRKERKRADFNRADFLEAEQTIAELRKVLEVARKECKAAAKELGDLRENHCTCPHDYFHGDHHYMYCPAADEMKVATKRIWSGLNRPAYFIDKALAAIATTGGQ